MINKGAVQKVLSSIYKFPPLAPPYTREELLTKRFPILCKEGLREVVV